MTSGSLRSIGRWFAIGAFLVLQAKVAAAQRTDLAFCCSADNDLFRVLKASGMDCPRSDQAGEAVDNAPHGATVMILADGYPAQRTQVDAAVFERATAKGLQLYIEYPASIPGLAFGPPRKTSWERVVVASEAFGDTLPAMQILMAQGCQFLPTTADHPLLITGRVAGFDRAVFGLPKERWPILFELPERKLTIATTKLSGFVTGRYAPSREWRILWEQLLGRLTGGGPVTLQVAPLVHPAYASAEPLPADVEKQSLAAFTRWVADAKLLVHPSQREALHKLLAGNAESLPMPPADAPSGDGREGLLEGFASEIAWDGSQQQRAPLRCDCHAEVAACMALDALVNGNARSRKNAENLLDYVCFTSEAMRGGRGNPAHPAFGHVAWGVVAPAWRIANYGDDNARVIEATMLAAACLRSDRWDEPILRALLANLRTTGKLGFRSDRIDMGPLEQLGWRHFADAETVNPSPHFEAGMWTCYLWAYGRTGHKPFLETARAGITRTMAVYPDGWRWRNNPERVRMIHALAWLCRVENTALHRDWLRRVLADLLACQDPATGAIREVGGRTGNAFYMSPTSNEEYGTREMPIIQDDSDSASDQLYVTGFTLLVLHESRRVLDDPTLKEAENKLAAYLCRIQTRSERLPYLNGGWFRAFDFKRWEYWASSGDAGWGAWSLEAGWGQAWGAIAMGLRTLDTTMWDLTADSRIGLHLDAVQQLMAVNTGGPWRAPATQPTH